MNVLRVPARVWNKFDFLTAWSGGFLGIFVMAWAVTRKPRFGYYVAVGSALNLLLFIIATIPDARYSLYLIDIFVIEALVFIFNYGRKLQSLFS